MTRIQIFAAVACAICIASAGAVERKAYKYTDEKGNVTYSQTPPANKDAKTIDITPAQQGRGGAQSPRYGYPYASSGSYADQRNDAMRAEERRRAEAQREKLAQLESECNRSRGTDCKNQETPRYMEAQKTPRGYHPR